MDSASSIAAAVTAGRIRAGDVLAAHEARDRETHPRLNALVQRRPRDVVAAAAAVDAGHRGGVLAGVPLSVKECFPVRGLRTTLGIEARRNATDTADAPLVAALAAAGALVVGKGNVPQAMCLHETDNPVWGRTCHPLAADRSPGGSSGGDAALVAAGVVPLAVGTDLAGSLRQPAHACGIATLMPRSAVLGEGGAVDIMPHLRAMRPRAGFLARDVADLRLALKAVAPALTELPPAAGPVRIGWWDHTGPVPPSAAVTRAVTEAVARLERSGVAIVPLDPALAEEAAWLHLAFMAADGGADVRTVLAGSRRMPGVRRLLALAALPRAMRPAAAALARLAGRRLEARAILATGRRSDPEVAALLEARDALAARFAALVAGCDALVCPVSAVPALRHGTAARLVLAAAPCLPANLFDLAAGAVPVTAVRPDEEDARPSARDPVLRAAAACDRGSRGLPVGVQVVACPGRTEATVLDVMELIERGA